MPAEQDRRAFVNSYKVNNDGNHIENSARANLQKKSSSGEDHGEIGGKGRLKGEGQAR